jgi:DNA polymerase III subunit epsilon
MTACVILGHEDYFYFDRLNTLIHGLKEEDVEDAPEFNEAYKEILPFLNDAVIVAHNAAFDMSVLRHVLDLYDMPYPIFDYLCTYKIALQTWQGMKNYKLDTICEHFNFNFTHHNSEQDAIACGYVLGVEHSRNRKSE